MAQRTVGRASPRPSGQHGLVLRGLRVGFAILALMPAPRAAGAPPADAPQTPISVRPPSDYAIERRIHDVLTAIGGVEELDVQVHSGIVHLAGQAGSLALRDQATDLARRVDGVVLVRNDLHVASDVRGRTRPTWAKLKSVLAEALGFLPVVAVSLAAFAVFAILAHVVGRTARPFRRLGLSELGVKVLRTSLRALLLVAGLVLALDLLGVTAFVGTVVGALGIVGVVAGIAFRDVVANYLPGIMLGLNPPFEPGDEVLIGPHSGRVVRVTSRETILVADDGQHLRIPNVRLLAEPIVNLERHRERRLRFELEVALLADLRQVRDVGNETLRSIPGVLREPGPFMRVLGITAEQVRVGFFAWVDQRAVSFLTLESRARQAVKEALLDAGIPFPMQEIAVHRPRHERPDLSADEEDSDRQREERLVEEHVRKEQAAPGERDLLREGRSRPS
jgi:small-conductance mechanosensitive channel